MVNVPWCHDCNNPDSMCECTDYRVGISTPQEQRDRDKSHLYYEAHVTIEPVFDGRRDIAAAIARRHKFKLAALLMQKEREATEVRSDKDTFMTGHSRSYNDIATRTMELVKDLKIAQFKVWRYKIEDTILDSRHHDAFKILPNQPVEPIRD